MLRISGYALRIVYEELAIKFFKTYMKHFEIQHKVNLYIKDEGEDIESEDGEKIIDTEAIKKEEFWRPSVLLGEEQLERYKKYKVYPEKIPMAKRKDGEITGKQYYKLDIKDVLFFHDEFISFKDEEGKTNEKPQFDYLPPVTGRYITELYNKIEDDYTIVQTQNSIKLDEIAKFLLDKIRTGSWSLYLRKKRIYEKNEAIINNRIYEGDVRVFISTSYTFQKEFIVKQSPYVTELVKALGETFFKNNELFNETPIDTIQSIFAELKEKEESVKPIALIEAIYEKIEKCNVYCMMLNLTKEDSNQLSVNQMTELGIALGQKKKIIIFSNINKNYPMWLKHIDRRKNGILNITHQKVNINSDTNEAVEYILYSVDKKDFFDLD